MNKFASFRYINCFQEDINYKTRVPVVSLLVSIPYEFISLSLFFNGSIGTFKYFHLGAKAMPYAAEANVGADCL